MKRMRLLVFISLIIFSGAWASPDMVMDYHFDTPRTGYFRGFDTVEMPGTFLYGEPGSPMLPVKGCMLLLPPGEIVRDVKIVTGNLIELPGTYNIIPSSGQEPLCMMSDHELLPEKNEAIYSSTSMIPAVDFERDYSQTLRGHRIAVLRLFPVKYIPATGKLYYYDRISVELTTQPSEDVMESQIEMIRDDYSTKRMVTHAVDNPSMLDSYSSIASIKKEMASSTDDDDFDYVIITTETYEQDFQAFADFKNARGVKTAVVLLSDIKAGYSGVDTQDKIRNFLKDAYINYGITYVLMGGDDEILPHRGLYANVNGNYPDKDIPADLYFAALDRVGSGIGPDWDVDNDRKWGEPSEADLMPELLIGRAPIDSHTEAFNFLTKQMMYEAQPVTADCLDALLLGENLGWFVWGKNYMEELRLGSDKWGFTTVGFEPGIFNVDHLYDKEGTWDPSTLIDKLNLGVNMVHHLGHAINDYDMKLYNSDISRLHNDGITAGFFIHYTQGCYCGAWDNRTPEGYYTDDAFNEVYTTDDNGAVCIISNSRYGWGNVISTYGSSQFYERQFVDAIFGENLFHIGEVEEDSKIDNIPMISEGANRWVHYELCLMGDPELDMWTDIPVNPDVDHPETIVPGESDFTVTVTYGGMPIENARVSLRQEGSDLFVRGFTDNTGSVTLHLLVESTLPLDLSVTAHNCYQYTATVIPISEGPYVFYLDNLIDDDTSGESVGNSDGIVNCGETIELPVELKNWGSTYALGTEGTMSVTDTYTTITDGFETFGDIAPEDSAWSDDDFGISVSKVCPDHHVITCDLTITDTNSNTWESSFSIIVSAPVINVNRCNISDPAPGGNDNGFLEPGESGYLYFKASNSGSATATGITATLTTDDPYITINRDYTTFPDIASGENAYNDTPYEVTIAPDCPDGHEILLSLAFDGDWFMSENDFPIIIKETCFSDDMESGEGNWNHSEVTSGYNDEWHISTESYHSAGHSWKCGDTGSGNYGNFDDSGLVTPFILMPSNPVLTFWHRMDAELNSSDYAWDGGIVEISTNIGITWTEIEPDDGYPYKITDSSESPFPAETPCFSGSFTWQKETFHLNDYGDQFTQIRFRFGSDEIIGFEGWYIDDIEVAEDTSAVITMTPDFTTLQRGDTEGITFVIENRTDSTSTFDVWTEITLPDGKPYSKNPHMGPEAITLDPGESMTVYETFEIPYNAPAGTYTYKGITGQYPDIAYGSDSFEGEVTD